MNFWKMRKMNNPLIQFLFILLIHHVFTKGRLRLDLIQFLYKQYKHNDNLNLVFNCMMNEVKSVDWSCKALEGNHDCESYLMMDL